jgi:uncharacterized protein (TIGR02145 family)
MKEAGLAHWKSPNANATNSSGFTAVPGGVRYIGAFYHLTEVGYHWSTTHDPGTGINPIWETRFHQALLASINGGTPNGYSIRCMKDKHQSTNNLPDQD